MTEKKINEGYFVQKMRDQLVCLLRQIQKLADGKMFIVAGQAIAANDLAKILIKPFRGGTTHEFSIGEYHVSLILRIPGKLDFPEIIMSTGLNKQIFSLKKREIEYERTEEFTYNFQDLQALFRQLMQGLGNYNLYHDYDNPGVVRPHTLFSALLQEATVKNLKKLPSWSRDFILQARQLVAVGDVETLRKKIEREINRLRSQVIAEARPVLRSESRKLIAAAEANKIALAPKLKGKKS